MNGERKTENGDRIRKTEAPADQLPLSRGSGGCKNPNRTAAELSKAKSEIMKVLNS